MKKYVSRAKNRLALILLYSFLFLFVIGYLLPNGIVMLVSLLFLIAGVILMFTTNRCPHCGAYFRGLYWSKANAGHCIKCGEIIAFDDCND